MRSLPRVLFVVAIAAGCSGTTPTSAPATPTLAPTSTSSAAVATSSVPPTSSVLPNGTTSPAPTLTMPPRSWEADIAMLVPRMDLLHPQVDHSVSLDELNSAAAQLTADAPTLSDEKLLDGVMSIVASVSSKGCDAHTGAYVWGYGSDLVSSLPLRLWIFEDGVYVVDAMAPYESLIGTRIDTLAGVPIADAIAAVDPLIPRDNDWTVRNLTPRYLLMPQALAGVGIPATKTVTVTTTNTAGESASTDVTAIAQGAYNGWAGQYGLFVPAAPDVLYLSNMNDALWWQDLGDGTLFVQYNEVRFVSFLFHDLHDAITAPGIKRVVLDLRHNTGGEVRAMQDMVEFFKGPDVVAVGAPYVITSRNTFSAAGLLVAKLQAEAGATIVGEPMGACPTSFGNAREFKLPFSGITVSVATELEVGVTDDDARSTIEPDIPAPLTAADWAAGRDPALEAIQALPTE